MNTNFYNNLANFLKKRTFELIGLMLILTGILLSVSFITYSPNDPSFIFNEDGLKIQNFFGIYGSIVSDFLLQSFGLVSFLLLITIISSSRTIFIGNCNKGLSSESEFCSYQYLRSCQPSSSLLIIVNIDPSGIS